MDWSDAAGPCARRRGLRRRGAPGRRAQGDADPALRRRARRHRARARGGGDGRHAAPDRVSEHRRRRRGLDATPASPRRRAPRRSCSQRRSPPRCCVCRWCSAATTRRPGRCARGRAARVVPLVRGGASLEQPIDARDVLAAIAAALARPELAGRVLDVAGPESLPRRDLVRRAAALLGNAPRIVPIPLALVRSFAALRRTPQRETHRSPPRCSTCSSTTTASTEARLRRARHHAHTARRDAASRRRETPTLATRGSA